jgi:hypothetical protein
VFEHGATADDGAKLLDPAPAAEVLQQGAHARALPSRQDDAPELSACG